MALSNTAQTFGAVTRSLHWLTALIILTALPLGVIANRLPYDTAEALATKAQLFSIHKTLGVAAFLISLARIGWALIQPRPAPLHPERRAEVAVADLVHWLLYISLLIVPLSGWIHHAAVTGFAPILWPFGQTLPFVPQSETVATAAGAAHWVFTKVMALTIILHILGALKHHVFDKDATLRRMTRGTTAPANPARPAHGRGPALVAFVIYALGAGIAGLLVPPTPAPAVAATIAQAPATTVPATGDRWQVRSGTLGFSVNQMGATVEGSFANWTADIAFAETPTEGKNGTVTVTIDTTSLALGSVTEQAKAAEFFDTAAHPTATFTAEILPEGADYVAKGTLSLRGTTKDLGLPFTLKIDGNMAEMSGTAPIDRRDFGMGTSFGDESQVGFVASVSVKLTAERQP